MNINTDVLKLENMGFVAIVENDHVAHTIIGTPKFMAHNYMERIVINM
jgi:hypothetical protein